MPMPAAAAGVRLHMRPHLMKLRCGLVVQEALGPEETNQDLAVGFGLRRSFENFIFRHLLQRVDEF